MASDDEKAREKAREIHRFEQNAAEVTEIAGYVAMFYRTIIEETRSEAAAIELTKAYITGIVVAAASKPKPDK